MGKSGMKRKGRQHLPKAGTRPSRDALAREHRNRATHPFSSNPSGRQGVGWAIGVALLAVLVVIALVVLVALD